MRLKAGLLVAALGIVLALSAAAAAKAAEVGLEIDTSTGSGYGEVLCKQGAGPSEECEYEYEYGTKLTLVPTPEAESIFAGFKAGTASASACTGTGPCSFSLKADSSIQAPFELAFHTLTIALTGQGEGEVSCAVEGSPPEACEDEYPQGTELTLSGEAGEGSEFDGFQNAQGSASTCFGTEPCSFILSADASLQARFEPIRHLLTIAKAGSGSGTVHCNGAPCLPSYPEGEAITLSATAAAGSAFTGFSGEGCVGSGPCLLWVEGADLAVVAAFAAEPLGPALTPPPQITHCTVPRLAAKSIAAARSALTAAHCSLGRVQRPKPRKGKRPGPLAVRASRPAAGSVLAQGAKVELVLGKRRGK